LIQPNAGQIHHKQVASHQLWLNQWNAGHIDQMQVEWIGYMLTMISLPECRPNPSSTGYIKPKLAESLNQWNAGHIDRLQVEWI
jgi:hypothetical protein